MCRTDLYLAEGDLVPRRALCVPGHEAVGRVVALGSRVAGHTRGERVGIAWLAGTCGECSFCRRGAENLCGTLAIAGIHLSAIPPLDYAAHLFQERTLRSVTANTRADGRELFAAVARSPVRVRTTPYPLDEADRALEDLAADRVEGAAVLIC